jgi:hypothetical protein
MPVKKTAKTNSNSKKPAMRANTQTTTTSPTPDFKMIGAGANTPAEPVEPPRTAAGATPAENKAAEESEHAPEKLGAKIRRKGDIIKALRSGAHVLHTAEGLYRIVDGEKVHPSSKRRISALIDSGILKRDPENDHRYLLDAAADSAASEAGTGNAVADTAS